MRVQSLYLMDCPLHTIAWDTPRWAEWHWAGLGRSRPLSRRFPVAHRPSSPHCCLIHPWQTAGTRTAGAPFGRLLVAEKSWNQLMELPCFVVIAKLPK